MTTRTMRRDARSIFQASLEAADPADAVARHLERRNFSRFRNIYVVGAGKAGASMAKAAERVLGKRITAGLINVKYGHLAKLRRIELNESGHPLPDARGVDGAARIAGIATGAQQDDLVVCLISGGASALLPLPASGITLDEKQAVTRQLLACGATIHEINAVRKHISRIKGGQLARLAWPAAVEALLLSDVIGDDLDVIGSGPTAPDSSTFGRAAAILEKYGIAARVPAAVQERIAQGMRGAIPETPKPDDPLFARVRNVVVGSNRLALQAAARRARELGYRPLVLASGIEGETREIARMHAAIARERRPTAARLHHHRRRDHRDAEGRRPGRPQPGVCSGRRHRYRGPAGTVYLQRGHRRHRRPHRRGRRHRRRRHPAPQSGRAGVPRTQRFLPLLSNRSATW